MIVPEDRTPTVHVRRLGLLVGVALLSIVLDVVSKLIVVSDLDPMHSTRILGGAVYFSLIRNGGAAFGVANGMTVVFALVAVAVVGSIIRMAPKLRSGPWAVGLGLVLGGAIGNLIDRIFRSPGLLRGHVIDWISVFGPDGEHFPVFNLADSSITIGVVVLGFTALLGIELDGTRR